jgi:uncharacterized protein (TIGR03435 family)
MKKLMLCFAALAAAGVLCAQNINATWQGTLRAGPQELRVVIKIAVDDKDKLKADFYSIDQKTPAIPASSVTRDGSALKMLIPALNGTYEGRLSADANTITGTWTQGGPLIPLVLTRATPDTAWTIPDPPPPPKTMPADATPSFEVSTIKPSKPEERFSLLVNRSGMLNTTDSSLSDLIKFAYDLHPRQITGGPAWLETEKYDISAKPDTEGIPNGPQLKMMVQKLLAERFELKFHRDKKELSAYAITVAKPGPPKLTKNDSNPTGLPGFGGGGPSGMLVRNATMAEFANVLQSRLLERPVVDQTGLGTQRWDFVLKWTLDASQMAAAGAPPNVQPPADNPDAPPDIFAAMQQQLGLKLDSTKAPVDVMVIDKVEKPSAN